MRVRISTTLALVAALLLAPAALARDSDGDRITDDLEQRLTGVRALKVILQLDGEPTDARLGRLKAAAGSFPVGRRLERIDSFAASLTPVQVRRLARASGVRRIDFDRPMHAVNGPGNSAFGVSQARAQLPGLDGDRDGSPSTYSPGDLVAAVIDSGVDATHQDLDGGKVIAFRNFVTGQQTPFDNYGHGTHVAATLAGDGDASGGAEAGVAPRAGLVGLKVLDSTGTGDSSDVAAAIEWAVDNRVTFGIEAINLSLGGLPCDDGTDAVAQEVDAASAAGVVVVAAAGNDGPDTCTVSSPGTARSAITVGAMADLSQAGFWLADFSSRGPTADGRIKPDVLGPGVAINSAQAGSGGGYVVEDGTSMATPFVTGVALLMRDALPALSPAAVKGAMMRSAIDWGPGGQDIDYGAGRLDAHAALRAAGVTLGTAPSLPPHRTFAVNIPVVGGVQDIPLSIATTRWPIAVTLLRSSGALVGLQARLFEPSGAGGDSTGVFVGRQAVLTENPTTAGTYRLRVSSILGGSVRVDVSAGFAAPPPVTTSTRPAPPIALEPIVSAAARSAARALRKITRRKLRRRRAFRFTATVPLAGKLAVRLVNRKGNVTIAKGTRTFTKAGAKRVRVKLTKRGRRYLKRHRTRRFTVRVAFRDTAKRRAFTTRKARLKKVAR